MDRSILFVMARLTHSGVETMLRAAGPEWRDRGWGAHILATGEMDEGPFAHTLRESGYQIHHIPFRRHIGFLIDVFGFLRKHRFAIVHIFCERANVWLGMFSVLSGSRTFRTVNNVFRFTGGLLARRWSQRRLLRWLGVVTIAPSQGVLEQEARCFANPCRLLAYWIDDDRFPLITSEAREQGRRDLGIPQNRFVLLSAGSCHPYKNHRGIIEALTLLPDDVLYLHAGRRPLEDDEIALAESQGVSARIHRLGVVDEMSRVLAVADAFIMPSPLNEGLGLAAVEALVSGLPCILSRVDGLSDLTALSTVGAWCDVDAASIAKAVRMVMASSPEARQMRVLADAERTRHLYSWRQGVDRMLHLYGRQP